MKGTPAVYLGRIVDKKHFRTFIYGAKGEKKLVESWDEFEVAMQSGIWFATIEDAKNAGENTLIKPKRKYTTKPKALKVHEVEEEDEEVIEEDDGTVFEVTDDFLPGNNE